MATVLAEYQTPSGCVLQVCQGDLTLEATGAIVNAANEYLYHGGGVAAAIVRRGGRVIQEQSDAWTEAYGEVPTGQVAITEAGTLACRYVIHAVGPIWKDGAHQEDDLLRSAVSNSLQKAHELQLSSIALPAISSGIFGFPKERCAEIVISAALDFCAAHPTSSVRQIRFTNNDTPTATIFQATLAKL